jgi:hypothetical protein
VGVGVGVRVGVSGSEVGLSVKVAVRLGVGVWAIVSRTVIWPLMQVVPDKTSPEGSASSQLLESTYTPGDAEGSIVKLQRNSSPSGIGLSFKP